MPTAIAQEATVQVAGVGVRSRRRGEGPPVVVMHPSIANLWGELHDDLATDHEVHALDLPGFDGTDRPDWARHPRDLALLVGGWIRRRDLGRVAVVGFELSGWVAAELATMAPELIDRMVLVGAAGLLPEEGRYLDMMLISHGEYVRSSFSSPEAYESTFGPEYTDELLLRWDLNREMVARIAWKPYMYNRQLAPLLTEVEAPTLLVWGECDRVVPRSVAQRYRELLASSHLEVVPGCGHAVGYERPGELATLVRDHLRR